MSPAEEVAGAAADEAKRKVRLAQAAMDGMPPRTRPTRGGPNEGRTPTQLTQEALSESASSGSAGNSM